VFELVWLGGPFLLGAGLAVLFARGRWRLVALLAFGVVLGFLLLLYAYLQAPPNYSESNGCSDCEEYLGRWWEPVSVTYLAIIGYVLYVIGVGVGALVRLLIPSRPARGSSGRGG
jgi:hypothetical protein